MTREEVIVYFKKNAIRIKGIMAEEDEALKDRLSKSLEATNMAIKALEQESILDKIRAELHATAEMHIDGCYYLREEWIDEIIDKYKAGK